MLPLLFFMCIAALFRQGCAQCTKPVELEWNEMPALFEDLDLEVLWGDNKFFCNDIESILFIVNGVVNLMPGGGISSPFTCNTATSQWVKDVTDPNSVPFPSDAKIKCISLDPNTMEKCDISLITGFMHEQPIMTRVGDSFSCLDGKEMKLTTTSGVIYEGSKVTCISDKQYTLDFKYQVGNDIVIDCLSPSPCTFPPLPAIVPGRVAGHQIYPLPNGQLVYRCPFSYFPYGNLQAPLAGNPLVWEINPGYTCDVNTGKFVVAPKLTTFACVKGPSGSSIPDDMCSLTLAPSTTQYLIMNNTADITCPPGQIIELQQSGATISKLNCKSYYFHATYPDGTTVKLLADPNVECVPAPTTTTTTAAPTSVKDQNLPSSHLLALTVYYNAGLGVHAFCSNPACYNAIQSNGIGYDPNNVYWMGKVVSSDAGIAAAAKNICPIGWSNMRLLGFQKSGYAYEHNLSGAGLVIGYVSIAPNNCGATEPIKKWKSKVNTDIMYGIDLEWNSWYTGMVQNGGSPYFYIWKSTY